MAVAAQALMDVEYMCIAVSAVATRIPVILAPALGNNAVVDKDCSTPFSGMAELATALRVFAAQCFDSLAPNSVTLWHHFLIALLPMAQS